jgi:hypothetical protein
MITTKPRKNERKPPSTTAPTADERSRARLLALEDFNMGLKSNSLGEAKSQRATDADKRQKAARNALIGSNRTKEKKVEKPVEEIYTREDVPNPPGIVIKKKRKRATKSVVDLKKRKISKPANKVTVEEEMASTAGLDLSDLTYEQIEALREYGGLTGNMTREQVDEIINRVSPLTEDGTPFVISTPRPKKRFLSPIRLKVKDITTGREIVL